MILSKYRSRLLITILLIVLAYSCFTVPPPKTTETIKLTSPERTVSTEVDHGAKFYEWVGLLALALSVWIWRRELQLTGFGPFSGPPIEQQGPEEYRREKSREEKAAVKTQSTVEAAMKEMSEDELHQRKDRILEMVKKGHAVNVGLVAKDLSLSYGSARALLFLLVMEGKLRGDGYPKRALYTLTSSLDNLAIDRIRSLIEKHHLIRSDRRFVRVQRSYELDAVLQGEDKTFLIEVKYLKRTLSLSILEGWMTRFLRVADLFGDREASCYLVIVAFEGISLRETREQISKVTYDFGSKLVQVVVVGESELKASEGFTEQDAPADA